MVDINAVVRIVDDFLDDDYHTRDSCPGTVLGHKLIRIGVQIQRRRWRRDSVKHIIYQLENTRQIWYKTSKCNAGVVAMGFSLSQMDWDYQSVPMETYAGYFLSGNDPEWLERNDYKLD